MTVDAAFAQLMDRLRAGDPEAAEQVYRLYARRLIGLARSRLGGQLRQKVDPEDVLQSVYKSFFFRHAEGRFELDGWDSLWGLLAAITLRKCGHRIEHFHAACRDVGREAVHRPAPEDSRTSWVAVAREPTPDEAAILTETLEQVMVGLDDWQRRIVQLSLQGYSTTEVSAQVSYTTRTVQRTLERVRRRLEQLQHHDEQAD